MQLDYDHTNIGVLSLPHNSTYYTNTHTQTDTHTLAYIHTYTTIYLHMIYRF